MNTVTREEPLSYLPFKDVEYGDPFFCRGETYVKMRMHKNEPNACCLKNGDTCHFNDTEHVTTVAIVHIDHEPVTIDIE